MATHENTICSQILTSDDLIKEKLFLSHITSLSYNIGFEIIDEVTYNVLDKKDLI